LIFIVGPLFLVLSLVVFQYSEVNGVKFDPVPFDNIPIAKINSNNGEYKIGVDFSIDFGDEPVIKKNNHSSPAKNMVLNVDDNGISLELECDSNDICGTSLAPQYVKIYLVNSDISYEQIVNNSIPNMELAYNDCGTQSIKNCANIDFSIPSNVTRQNYSIVLDMSFDEAQWIFINPVKILKH
jgi:hypothetical protein